MEVTAVVLHKGALAHYTVEKGTNELYTAHLIRYGGAACDKPPKHLHFIEQGRHGFGNVDEQELIDDLWYTAKQQLGGTNPPQQQGPSLRS